MNKIRKICFVILTLLVCLSTVIASVLPVFAESGESGGISWDVTGGVLNLSGEGRMPDFSEEEPAPWAAYAQSITRVVVGEGITTVGHYAFCGMERLVSVSLPSTLTNIGRRSFKGCVKLPTLVFPKNLKVIDEAAFEGCASLDNIRFPASLGTIRDYAFYRCSSLKSITVPDTVYYLGKVVFAYCSSMTQAQILCRLKQLPDSTFYACDNLSVIVLPEDMTEIGEHVFYNCTQLETIYYNGESTDEIYEQIVSSEDNTSPYLVIQEGEFGGSSTGTESPTDDSTVHTETQTTENATITLTVEEEYKFILDGEEIDPGDIDEESTDLSTLEIETDTKAVITATVENDEGLDEVIDAVNKVKENFEDLTVDVTINDPNVDGTDLAKLSGVEVVITTADGTKWMIPSGNRPEVYKQEIYCLSTTVSRLEGDGVPSGITSEGVYKVQFGSNTDFNSTVGMYIGNGYSTATLYHKLADAFEKVQTSIIDSDGMAWFHLANVDKDTEYVISVNDTSVKKEEAIIPPTLYDEYGIDKDAVLMDVNGVIYAQTGYKSSFGVTGGQFALFVAAGMIALVVIIGGVMFVIYRTSQIKQKYENME